MKKILLGLVIIINLNANDIVMDNETGLIWQDNSNIIKNDWNGAKSYCKNLTLGGYSDWRLPNIDELMSITDKNRYNPAIKDIFKNIKNSWYWSSSQVVSDSSRAWIVDFDDGDDYWHSKTGSYYVRCVK